MKTLVVYSSQSGNTKKLAKAVHDTLKGDIEMFPVEDAPAPDGYDLVAAGFWLQAGKPDPKSGEYLSKLGSGSRVFLFATHGAKAGSDHVNNALSHAKELVNGADVAGTFTCQGEVNPKVLEKIRQKETPPPWINDADLAVGHPDEADLSVLKAAIEQL